MRFDKNEKLKLFFYLTYFFLLFMDLNALFGTIYEFYCIISTNFYLYLHYFQQKVYNFNKISGFQTDPKQTLRIGAP